MNSERNTFIAWHTVDFKPAPPGWRVVALFGDRCDITPIAGWLVQEGFTYNEQEGEAAKPEHHRIVPGICAEGFSWSVEPIDENLNADLETWKVLGPGEPEPTDDEVRVEIERRTQKAGS